MAEVIRVFDEPIRDGSGLYHARVIGRRASDGLWEGWLEFMDGAGRRATPLMTAVESRQPGRRDLAYWASGLSTVYAEGALARARRPAALVTRIVETPFSSTPAGTRVVRTVREPAVGAQPVLNPFDVGGRSLEILTQELGALGRARLLNIIAAYRLNPSGRDLSTMNDAAVIAAIVAEVGRRRSAHAPA